MAKAAFDTKLYDIIERHQHATPEVLERFKALGDDAWVVEDLGCDSIAFYLDDIQKLLKSCGVLSPEEQKVSPFWWLWPDTCLVYRDFTVGELKELVRTKVWPPDAYSYEPVSLTQKIMSLSVMLVLGGLILGIIALLGFWLARWLS